MSKSIVTPRTIWNNNSNSYNNKQLPPYSSTANNNLNNNISLENQTPQCKTSLNISNSLSPITTHRKGSSSSGGGVSALQP